MIVNQDCQCNAPLAKAFVSSCPEWFIGHDAFDGMLEQVPQEFKSFFQKMAKCQELVHNDRFRCYGEVRQDGSHCMVLVTEFKQFTAETWFWQKLEAVKQATEAHLWVMDDEYEIEHSWSGEDAEGNRTGETFGPNHGRPFMQVELSWRIEKLSYNEIVALSERMSVATQEIWDSCGVGVC